MLANTARRAGVQAARSAKCQRGFFTGVFSDHPGQTPLDQEIAGVPATQPTASTLGPLQVTTLSNGLRVASQETCSPVASVGVYVDAGSRTEQRGEAGLSHLLQRLAFKSTQTRSHLRVVRDAEDAGLNLSALSSRDALAFSGEGLRSHLPELVGTLGESVMAPLLADWEVHAWQSVVHEYDSPIIESDANIALSEATHAAAFQDDTPLGKSAYVSSAKLGSVSSNDLRAFMTRNFAANTMVVAGAGVNHNDFVSMVDEAFGGAPATADGSASAATYVGGSTRYATPSPVAYFSIAFQGPSLNSSAGDIAAARVLEAVLGSTVTSNDGLGARQSRIAKLEADDATIGVASAFTRFYRDTGLIGVYACADEDAAGNSFTKLAAALKSVGDVSGDELTRAKNQAKMAYLTSVSTAVGVRSDIGSQLLLTGARAEAAAVAAAIDAVTAADVERTAAAALASDVSIAAVGGVANVPRYGTAAALFN